MSNSWYKMIKEEFPVQYERMQKFGRRNCSFSTVAPTGTVSLMTQTTSGLEPLFKAYYIRRKKINPNDKNARIDFVDQNGDKWQEYNVLHPKFKEWIYQRFALNNNGDKLSKGIGLSNGYKNIIDQYWNNISKQDLEELFELSPWYGSEANDISWQKRIMIQSVIQKYTSNAISSTINLPENVKQSVVKDIYLSAYKAGLKGITVYRDGSRSGVLVNESKKTTVDQFGYNDAIKRPKELEANYYWAKANGREYAVVIGLLNNNPYEVFAFANPLMNANLKGHITKEKSGVYSFKSMAYTIENLQLNSDHTDESLLTRWVSLMLRHGANPKFISEQVEKSQMQITSFAKVIARVLKLYIPDQSTKEKCDNCHEETIIYEEGCKRCTSCGSSKC